jgi:hypothetical protein
LAKWSERRVSTPATWVRSLAGTATAYLDVLKLLHLRAYFGVDIALLKKLIYGCILFLPVIFPKRDYDVKPLSRAHKITACHFILTF